MFLRYYLIILLLFISLPIFATHHIQSNHPDRSHAFALQQDLRFFFKVHPDIKLVAEFQAKELLTNSSTDHLSSSNMSNPEILAFRFGGLFRVSRNLKIGAYYQMLNKRNFENGNLDMEHNPILDIIPRFKISQFWVFELRIRNEFNYFDGSSQTREDPLWYAIKFRPRISYFIFDELKFKMAVFLAYEYYLPITYEMEHNEHWIYTGVTIPIYDFLSINPYYAWRYLPAISNLEASSTHILGLGLNFNF